MAKEKRSQSTIAKQKRWANEVKKRDCYVCVIEWSELLNINAKTLYSRKRYGWSDQKTLTEAVK